MPEAFGQSYTNLLLSSFAVVLVAAIALYAYHHRKITGAMHLFMVATLGILWGTCYLLEVSSRQTEIKLFWDSLQFVPVGFLPPTFLLFVIVFTRRKIIKHWLAISVIFAIPVLNLFGLATDKYHHLFRISFSTPALDNWMMPLSVKYGPLFWLVLVYSAIVMIVSVLLLIQTYIKSPRWERGKIAGILIGSALTLLAMIASIPTWVSEVPANITLIAMIISIAIIAVSLFSHRMLDVVPLARSAMLNQMADGVVTLNQSGQILDLNQAAESIPLLNLNDHIGESLPTLLHSILGFDLDLNNQQDHSAEITIGKDNAARTYDMRISPLHSGDKKLAGMLVVFRDITRRRLEELERVHIQDRYRAVFENPNFGILLVDKSGIILEANREISRMSGFSSAQILFREIHDLLQGIPEFGNKKSFPLTDAVLLHERGDNADVEVSITSIGEDGERIFFITVQDIRERKKSEGDLRTALENVQARNQELALMRNVTESLNQATSLRAAMLPALDTVVAITNAPTAWVYLLGKADQTFQRIEYHPLDEQNQLNIENMQGPLPKCLSKLSEGKVEAPRKIRDCLCGAHPLESHHFTLPLYIGKQPLGVLNFIDTNEIEKNENKIRLLHTVCDSLAVAVERVRLFKNEHDQRKLAETMRDVGSTLTKSLDLNEVLDLLLDQLSRMIPYDGANVMLIENNVARVARFRGYEQMGKQRSTNLLNLEYDTTETENLKRIIASAKPEIIPDTAEYGKWQRNEATSFYHAWLGAPVIIEGKTEALFSLEKVERGFYTQDHAKLLSVFSTQASLAIKNARLFSAEAKRIQELDALRATLTGISSQLNVNVLLNEIVKRAIKLLKASQGEIGLYDPELKVLHILVAENFSPDYLGTTIKLEEGVMGKVAQTHEALNVFDYMNWPGRMELYPGEDVHSYLAVPMLSGDKGLIGVIAVADSDKARVFSDNDLRLLNLFAQQATIALRNAQLFEEARKRAEEADTIRKAGAVVVSNLKQEKAIDLILEQLAHVVPYDSASVLLYQNGVLKIVGGHGFSDISPILGMEVALDRNNPGAIVFLENKPHLIKNIPDEVPQFNQYSKNNQPILSWLGVPLTIYKKPIGILSLDAHKAGQFTEEHGRLVSAFADQVAIALENSRLYENALQSASRFESLYKLSQAISANLRSDEIYPAIHQATQELMETEFFSISLIDEKAKTIYDVYMIDRGQPVELTSRPITQGLFGKVAQDGKSRLYNTFDTSAIAETGAVLIGDLNEDEISQSVLVVPLKIGTKLTGILSAQSYQPNAYSDTDLELLELLAANMAIAIENARLFGEVQELAITDPLTGLNNRRRLFELGEQEFNRSKRYGRPLSAIMLDLDHLKIVNDSYGHTVGDQVLIQFAETCRSCVRQVDVLCRYGGEEFMILLPETEMEEAFMIAERLRDTTEHKPIESSVGLLPITVSVGVATLDDTCSSLKELIDRADFAQYTSKDNGRNRTTRWSSNIPPRKKETGSLNPAV